MSARRHAVLVPRSALRSRAITAATAAQPDPQDSARTAGLKYVSDASPGIRRRRAGKGFVYLQPDGKRVRDDETLWRIQNLVIPPAWRDVWICSAPNGHIQAVGWDQRGRKQYKYHEK